MLRVYPGQKPTGQPNPPSTRRFLFSRGHHVSKAGSKVRDKIMVWNLFYSLKLQYNIFPRYGIFVPFLSFFHTNLVKRNSSDINISGTIKWRWERIHVIHPLSLICILFFSWYKITVQSLILGQCEMVLGVWQEITVQFLSWFKNIVAYWTDSLA